MCLHGAHGGLGPAGMRLGRGHGLAGAARMGFHCAHDLLRPRRVGLHRGQRLLCLRGAGVHRLGALTRAGELALDAPERLLGARGALLHVGDALGGAHGLGLCCACGLLRAAGAGLGLAGGVRGAGGVGAGGVSGLLGEGGQPLDRRHGVLREPCAGARAGGCAAAAAGPQLGQLMPEFTDKGACLVGPLVLILDRALERLQLRVGVGQVPRVSALLLDARACERLELRAERVQLGAQPLLLLGAAARLDQLGRQTLVPLRHLTQLLVALRGGVGKRGRKVVHPCLGLLDDAAQIRRSARRRKRLLQLLEPGLGAFQLLAQLHRRLAGSGALERCHPAAHLLQLVLEPRVAAARQLAGERLDALARVLDGRTEGGVVIGARVRFGERGLQLLDAGSGVAQVGLDPAAFVAGAPLLAQLDLERLDLLACRAQLRERGARLLELSAQVLLRLRRTGQLALQPLHELARVLEGGAIALALLARLVGLRAQLVENPPGVFESGAELQDALRRLRQLAAGDRGLLAGFLQLRRSPLERTLELVRAAAARLGSSSSSSGVTAGSGGSIRGRNATIVPAARSSSSRCASPRMAALIQSTTVRWLRWSWRSALPRGAAISSASRKPLNSRLWLIPTGTNVSVSSSSVPSLRRATVWVTPPNSGSSPATASVSISGRPSMRALGQPNSSSAGRLQRVTAPSRSVSTKRASTSWRSSSSTASAWAVAGLDSSPDTSR